MASASHPSLPLSGRVAIVTGASRGIGRAIALHLASLGADLLIGYSSNSAQADLVASQINSSVAATAHAATTPRAVAVRADVSDTSGVISLFEAAESAFGGRRPHIVVVCAGVLDAKYPTLADTSADDWDKTFAVNARGAFLCCKEAVQRVARGGGGRIITVSSSLVAALLPGYAAYVASKAAVEAMTKVLAKELKGTGITANCVAPGPVATELFFAGKSEEEVKRSAERNPMGRLGQPEDVAGLVGFLCTNAGEWVNGQVIRVNGGFI